MKSTIILGLALVCAPLAIGQQTLKTITVCELLQDPTKYNGKTIALRGEYSVGGHGLYLRGPDCDGLLITKGYRWPSSIWISLTRKEYQKRSMSFEHLLDAQIEVGAVRERQRRGKGASSEKVTVTFVGLFETREDLDSVVFQRPDGSLVGIGFGQAPGAPGQFFIDSVKDIVVEFGQGAPK